MNPELSILNDDPSPGAMDRPVDDRPFAGIIGHRGVIELLAADASAPAGAYLLIGAASVGKATLARHFAAAVVCPDDGRHDEGVACASCGRALRGAHPDIESISPAGAASLGVEQARDVVARAVRTPVEADHRVFVFEDAGMMTDSAANALLKTLEEPNPGTVFVLVAESDDDLPPTVASRCRTVHVGRVAMSEIVAGLRARGAAESSHAEAAALVAGGRVGMAVTLATRPDLVEFRRAWLGVALRVTGRPGDARRLAEEMIGAVAPLVEETIDTGLTKEAEGRARRRTERALLASGLEILASWYADAVAVQVGSPPRNSDLPVASLTTVDPATALAHAEAVLDAVVDLGANLRAPLVLSELFTRLGAG